MKEIVSTMRAIDLDIPRTSGSTTASSSLYIGFGPAACGCDITTEDLLLRLGVKDEDRRSGNSRFATVVSVDQLNTENGRNLLKSELGPRIMTCAARVPVVSKMWGTI